MTLEQRIKNDMAFKKAYKECALWSTFDEDDTPFDMVYSISDFSPEATKKIDALCFSFLENNRVCLNNAAGTGNYDYAQAGHDLWLTQHHHGAGFWDRQLDSVTSNNLTHAAEALNEFNLFILDGKVEIE